MRLFCFYFHLFFFPAILFISTYFAQYFAQILAIKLAPHIKYTDCSIRVYQSSLIVVNQLHFAQFCSYYAFCSLLSHSYYFKNYSSKMYSLIPNDYTSNWYSIYKLDCILYATLLAKNNLVAKIFVTVHKIAYS